MEQFEKVRKGLERFRADFKPFVGNSFDWERVDAALSLIRQQQERIKELEAAIAEWEKFAPFLYAHGMLHEPPKEEEPK